MIIHPEILIAPDRPIIKIRQSREQVNLDVELPKILTAQGWGIGTYFDIQFVSHERNRLLSAAQFVVTEEMESLQTTELNAYQPVTKTVVTRKWAQLSKWWTPEQQAEEKVEITQSQTLPSMIWNPGKKLHQVKLGTMVVFEGDKASAEHELAKLKAA